MEFVNNVEINDDMERDASAITIHVSFKKETFDVEINQNNTIHELKEIIAQHTNIPIENQKSNV